MKKYNQLTQGERYQIRILKKAKRTIKAIAELLGRSPSTISRELRRNRGGNGYHPKQAHRLAQERKALNNRKIPEETWSVVRSRLEEEWSPEQISAVVGGVSHERIYQWIYAEKAAGGQLWQRLRQHKPYRKRGGLYQRRQPIQGRRSIDERPEVVERRERVGDWEADTIIGKHQKQAIVTLVERRTGFLCIKHVKQKTASAVGKAIVALLKPYKDQVHTITSDNGSEFAKHELVAKRLEADFFFAHPHSSWERGSNENTNGLIRQYFPKGSDFSTLRPKDIQYVMNRLNNRPRKRLGFQTPAEAFLTHINVALQG